MGGDQNQGDHRAGQDDALSRGHISEQDEDSAVTAPPGDALRLSLHSWYFADGCSVLQILQVIPPLPNSPTIPVCNCKAESLSAASPSQTGQDGAGARGCSAHVLGKAAFSRTAR